MTDIKRRAVLKEMDFMTSVIFSFKFILSTIKERNVITPIETRIGTLRKKVKIITKIISHRLDSRNRRLPILLLNFPSSFIFGMVKRI